MTSKFWIKPFQPSKAIPDFMFGTSRSHITSQSIFQPYHKAHNVLAQKQLSVQQPQKRQCKILLLSLFLGCFFLTLIFHNYACIKLTTPLSSGPTRTSKCHSRVRKHCWKFYSPLFPSTGYRSRKDCRNGFTRYQRRLAGQPTWRSRLCGHVRCHATSH